MANFDKAIAFVLNNEGGYVDDPLDEGGATNFGISLRYLNSIGQFGDFDGDGHITANDIKVMTVKDAENLYQRDFWTHNGYYLIQDDLLATKVFDFSVNMGSSRANKLLQQASNQEAKQNILTVDGILGPKTFTAINSQQGVELVKLLASNASAFYHSIVANHPEQVKFLKGWLNRAFRGVI